MAGRAVLVIGAQGVLGSLCAAAFEREGWRVLRGGRRPSKDPSARLVDLDRPETLAEPCAEVDLVLSSVVHEGFAAERHVLANGGTLLDIGSLRRDQYQRLAGLEDAGGPGLVVLGGMAPGVGTLMLAELLERFPQADTLEIVFTSFFSPTVSAGRGGLDFLFSQLAAGAPRRVRKVALPEPFGERRALELSHGEEGWFGTLADGRHGRAYVCFAPAAGNALLLALNRMRLIGLLRSRAMKIGRKRLPRKPSTETKCDSVSVLAGRRRLASSSMQGRGDYALTVAATLALADTLLDLKSPPRGVRYCEELMRFEDVRAGCERRGARFALTG